MPSPYEKNKPGHKEKLLALLHEHPASHARDLAKITGLSTTHVSMYMHRLMKAGMATCDKSNGKNQVRWSAVDDDKVGPQVKRIVRKTWTSDARRDYLVEALFGRAA